MSVRSPLHDAHVALGATLVDFAGWEMPVRYGSDIAEHLAVRTAAGLFDVSHMGELWVEGPDAAQALDAAVVSRMTTVEIGRAKYTMLCAEDGGVIDDLLVYRTAEQTFLVVANAGNAAVVALELRARLGGFRCTLRDASAATSLIAIQGPAAAGIVAAMCETGADAVGALPYYAATSAVLAGGIPALVGRTGYTGEDGFELFVSAEDAPRVWALALASGAGAGAGLVPCGLAARDTLRLEAGMPLYGQELGRDRTPFDAGLGRVVHLGTADKPRGEFVGKAALAVAKERAAGEPHADSRVLVGLVGHGRRAARTGYLVVDSMGAEVGVVTSGAPSPSLGKQIAMAYVHPVVAAVGSALEVDVRGRREVMTVVALPFYQRGA